MKVVQRDQRKRRDRRYFVGVNIVWKRDRNQPCFACLSPQFEMLFPLLTALKDISHATLLCLCAWFSYTFVCPRHLQKNVCKRFLACMCKWMRLWAFVISQKSNAGLMSLQRDQRIWGLLSLPLMEEDIWMFACAFLSPSLCLKGEESVGYRQNTEHRRTLLNGWKSSTAFDFRNHDGGATALLIHAEWIQLGGRFTGLICYALSSGICSTTKNIQKQERKKIRKIEEVKSDTRKPCISLAVVASWNLTTIRGAADWPSDLASP